MSKQALVRAQLLERIIRLQPGEALEQERDLAKLLDVSRMTLREALRQLNDEGVIYSVRGKGTFVAHRRISKPNVLTSFSDDMVARNLKPGTRLLSVQEEIPDVDVAIALELSPEDTTFHLRRLRLADGYPMCLETTFLPAVTFPDLLHDDLTGSLYQLFKHKYRRPVVRANQTISALKLKGADADLLGVTRSSPALRVKRVGFDPQGKVIEYTNSLYRADRYDFELTVQR